MSSPVSVDGDKPEPAMVYPLFNDAVHNGHHNNGNAHVPKKMIEAHSQTSTIKYLQKELVRVARREPARAKRHGAGARHRAARFSVFTVRNQRSSPSNFTQQSLGCGWTAWDRENRLCGGHLATVNVRFVAA